MRKHAIIVAGGSGTRLGGEVPKQFQLLAGKPLLWWALKAFAYEDPATVLHLVLPSRFIPLWQTLKDKLPAEDRFQVLVHEGGSSRTESVLSALDSIPSDDEILVAVHDAARPLVSRKVIEEGWGAAADSLAAIPVVAVTDSLRHLEPEGSRSVSRSEFVAVQTPQVFRADILKKAYGNMGEGVFTDDASVVEASGITPRLFPGSPDNIKVTNPGDLEIAELLLNK
ncbi:MAG: 2-C-methyl-D-erythritol 4-phosphate cytidylyltransferase [Muribaculaceae bacterium]|nr:2-C-methyl-D-erythritol 4-phosphate cytidylyltransferase [Muribaculaceae bacterium]